MSLAWLKANVLVGSVSKLVAASLFIATFGLTGCGDDPVKAGVAKGCTLNSDCSGGLVCSFGLCHQECQNTDDCPAGQRCLKTEESNVCQLDNEAQCHFKSDCKDPLVCAIDLQCRNQCQEDEDCLKGQKCADHTCAEPEEVNDEGGLKGAVGFGGEGGGGNDPSPSGGKGGTGGSTNGDAGGEGGMPPSTECVAGEECVPEDEPCQVGTVACTGGVATCEVVSDADDGTECGTDQVCSDGACVACQAGKACDVENGDGCVKGELSCATGPSCEVAGNQTNGKTCGTDKVCASGTCTACKVGDACDPVDQLCKNGVLSCSAGPVCNPTTNKAAGFECDTDKVCDSAASCVACKPDAACEPVANECHLGKQECATGPNCVDQQLPADDGVSCTSGSGTYNFCTAGACVACQNNNPCIPANPCHKGSLNCATTPPTCTDLATNATDGLACGDEKSCIAGECLANDRKLSVNATPAGTTIDAAFGPVTVTLLDKNDAPVPGTTLTVVAPAGASAGATTTSIAGTSQITGRVGRTVGAHKFTVSAPGASSVEFTVQATAPANDAIYTLVNVNHLSGVPTTPVAGTAAKLSGEARAMTVATDGTVYVGDNCTVYKLSAQGALTRIAGAANGGCGDAGDNGPGTSATLYYPSGLALDETQNVLYIAQTGYPRVRQVDLATGKIYAFAGSTGASNVSPWGNNGPADAAYVYPSGVGVAPNGDLFISDQQTSQIRRVNSARQITAYLGRDVPCTTDGPLTFYNCGGQGDSCSFAWDKDGRPFVSAYFCGAGLSNVRGVARVQEDGSGKPTSLTLIAGTTGVNVGEGGTATAAGFKSTPGLAFDKAGNLYLSTRGDNLIRRIDSLTDQITTVAGTGEAGYAGDYVAGTTAKLDSPTTIGFDGANNLYFADSGNFAVRSVWNVGDLTVGAGKLATTGGTGQTVKRDALFQPLSVKVTDGADAVIQGVPVTWKRIDLGSGLSSTGAASVVQVTTILGISSMSGRVGLASGNYKFEASFADIHGVAVTGSPQSFTVTAEDPAAGTIFPVVSTSHTSKLGSGTGPATFTTLYGGAYGIVSASDGTFYVSENCAVYKVTPRGEISVFAGTPGTCAAAGGDSGPAVGAKLYYPRGMAIDETNGILYIADSQNSRIRAVTMNTSPPKISTFAGGAADNGTNHGDGGPATAANLGVVYSVTVGPDGKVYVPDTGRGVRVVDGAGTITTWLGQNYPSGCALNTPALYYTDTTTMVRFASNGDAYVSGRICEGASTSETKGIVVVPAAGGALTRIAGLSTGATTDGILATAALLPAFNDFIIDGSGNIFLALANTTNGNRIRRIDNASKQITTIAGDGTAGYSVGSASGDYVASTTVRVYDPSRLALWPGGHLLIADDTNYTVRMIW